MYFTHCVVIKKIYSRKIKSRPCSILASLFMLYGMVAYYGIKKCICIVMAWFLCMTSPSTPPPLGKYEGRFPRSCFQKFQVRKRLWERRFYPTTLWPTSYFQAYNNKVQISLTVDNIIYFTIKHQNNHRNTVHFHKNMVVCYIMKFQLLHHEMCFIIKKIEQRKAYSILQQNNSYTWLA